MATIFRGPSFAPQPKARALPPDLIPNLLLSTLAVVAVVVPFRQTDWQNPVLRKKQVQDFQCSGVTTRGIVPPPPLRPNDWPNPVRRKTDLDYLALTNVTFAPVSGPPFYQSEWVAPPKARITPQDFSLSGVITRGIPPAVVKPPFVQSEWVTPLRPKAIPQAFEWAGATTRGIIPPPPFSQNEWPLASIRAKAIPYGEIPPNTTRIIPQPFPFRQTEWDQIRKGQRQPIQPEPPPNLRFSTLYVPPAPLPFSQYDWVTPRRYKSRVELFHWHASLNVAALKTVPNVVGLTQAAATTSISAAGLTTLVQTAYSSTIALGIVISQIPTSGALEVAGDAVTIIVSLGLNASDGEVVPYLIEASEISARFMLTQVYLVPNVIGTSGSVVSQSVEAFTRVPRGTIITITLGGRIYIPSKGNRYPPYGSGIV